MKSTQDRNRLFVFRINDQWTLTCRLKVTFRNDRPIASLPFLTKYTGFTLRSKIIVSHRLITRPQPLTTNHHTQSNHRRQNEKQHPNHPPPDHPSSNLHPRNPLSQPSRLGRRQSKQRRECASLSKVTTRKVGNQGTQNLTTPFFFQWGKAACLKRAPNVQRAIERYCRPRSRFAGFVSLNILTHLPLVLSSS